MFISKYKLFITGVIMLMISSICLFLYNYIGSSIDENGFLIEAFFLIPVGYLFFFIGLTLTLLEVGIIILKKVKKNIDNRNKI